MVRSKQNSSIGAVTWCASPCPTPPWPAELCFIIINLTKAKSNLITEEPTLQGLLKQTQPNLITDGVVSFLTSQKGLIKS